MAKSGWLSTLATLLGIGASVATISQALKTCPCDGTSLSFKVRCPVCGHDHWL